MAFIESPRFPAKILPQAVATVRTSTDITVYGSGKEYRNRNWLYPLMRFDFPQTDEAVIIQEIIKWFRLTNGPHDGFRIKDASDYIGNNELIAVADGVASDYQLIKHYQVGQFSESRIIKKPIASTVQVSVSGFIQDVLVSIDDAQGLVQFSTNVSRTISDITLAVQAQITFLTPHHLAVGYTIHISNVAGMVQINGQRAVVTSVISSLIIEVDLDSTAYFPYTSGGNTNTAPQAGEEIHASFEFDVPVRFENDELPIRMITNKVFSLDGLSLLELRE